MSDTYSTYADICAKFYALTMDAPAVAEFVMARSRSRVGERALFVGGMFDVAAGLSSLGLQLTVVDYTEEMVRVGSRRLPQCEVVRADLRELPFRGQFDTVFVVGRVFTHMTTDHELVAALDSCHQALRPSGKLFADNYEDSRIQVTSYFNGTVKALSDDCSIVRESSTECVSKTPFVVRWDARYSGLVDGTTFEFSDSIDHRAFSRVEFAGYQQQKGFKVLEQGDNFDETSFYTLSRIAG